MCKSALEVYENSHLLTWIKPRSAVETDLELVHTKRHIEHIKYICNSGGGYLDPDTPACRESYSIALKSAGAWMDGVEEVLKGNSAFVLSRPPGHHAESDRSMGFCFFSNAALAAKYALKNNKINKIAIFDWDVHHGNGTQQIVELNPNIAYASIHQYPFYPGTGSQMEKGKYGNVLNAPIPSGFGSSDYRKVFDYKIFPFIQKFAPDMLIISAGFDAHKSDPIAGINLLEEDFSYMTSRCLEIQSNILLGLEGGYNLDVLGKCCVAVINKLV